MNTLPATMIICLIYSLFRFHFSSHIPSHAHRRYNYNVFVLFTYYSLYFIDFPRSSVIILFIIHRQEEKNCSFFFFFSFHQFHFGGSIITTDHSAIHYCSIREPKKSGSNNREKHIRRNKKNEKGYNNAFFRTVWYRDESSRGMSTVHFGIVHTLCSGIVGMKKHKKKK